jgi:hypothetical protein
MSEKINLNIAITHAQKFHRVSRFPDVNKLKNMKKMA